MHCQIKPLTDPRLSYPVLIESRSYTLDLEFPRNLDISFVYIDGIFVSFKPKQLL